MKTENLKTIIIILIILTTLFFGGIITRHLFRQTTHARHGSARPKMAMIESAIDTFLQNTSEYPVTLEELIVDPGINGWTGPYLKKESQLYDPWGNPYIYELNGTYNPGNYDIISYGADGMPGGKGNNEDIYND